MSKTMNIPTPSVGEILREEFLEPSGITAYRLAKEINMSTTVLDILNNNRKITVDTALRLSHYFGNSARFWLNLQNDIIDIRNQQIKLSTDIEKIVPFEKSSGESSYPAK